MEQKDLSPVKTDRVRLLSAYEMSMNMRKTVMILLLFALTVSLLGCTAEPADDTLLQGQPYDTQPQQTQPIQTQPKGVFSSEAEDDYVRYSGGGISILLEGGFAATTAEAGYIVYTNGYLTVVISATDDYDAQMLSASGYAMETLTEEDYGSILIDTNKLDTDCIFYDHFDNICLTYSGKDSSGNEYEAYSVIKKDTSTNTFWLIQFIGSPAVYEPYCVYFPEWAASAVFTAS